MKLDNPLLTKTAGLILSGGLRHWMGSLDYKLVYYDPTVDPASPVCRGRGIFIFWHEYMPFLLYHRGNCDMAMLMSRHRDADLLSRLAMHFGFQFVRGSTARGGETAIREMMRKGRNLHLTITPDGPRGPRRRLAAGCIFLASRLKMPLIPIGLGYDRPWRLPTWDRFAVPRPFSRARCVVGPPIEFPGRLEKVAIEYYRRRVERLLQRLTQEAEAWAAAGTSKLEQVPLRPHSRPLPSAGPDLVERLMPLGGVDTPVPKTAMRRAA